MYFEVWETPDGVRLTGSRSDRYENCYRFRGVVQTGPNGTIHFNSTHYTEAEVRLMLAASGYPPP